MGDIRNAYEILVGKSYGKRPLERPISIMEDNIRMDVKEIGCVDVNWIQMVQNTGQWRAVP
jgi:hypothetical protein